MMVIMWKFSRDLPFFLMSVFSTPSCVLPLLLVLLFDDIVDVIVAADNNYNNVLLSSPSS